MSSGYLRLHRKLLASDVWQAATSEQQILLINLLLMASWREEEVILKSKKKLLLKPGQLVATVKQLEEACNIGETKRVTAKQIRTALKNFEKLNFVESNRASIWATDGMLITIVKWRFYQFDERDKGKQKGEQSGKQFDFLPIIENKKKGEKDNNKYNNTAHAREQTQNTEPVNEKCKSSNCIKFFENNFHPLASRTEAEAVTQLINFYGESAFLKAANIALGKGVTGSGACKYIERVLDSSSGDCNRTTSWQSSRRRKNDVAASTAEAEKILESGDLDDVL